MRKLLLALIALLLISCVNEINQPKLGKYRAEMITKDGSILPFNFEFLKKSWKLIYSSSNCNKPWRYKGWLNPVVHEKEKRLSTWRLNPKVSGISCCVGDIGTHAFNMVELVVLVFV